MGRNRSKETEVSLKDGTIEIDNSGHSDDHCEAHHGDTIDKMLIVILLILMAIVFTFMAIILRNLRIPRLLRYLYMGIDN